MNPPSFAFVPGGGATHHPSTGPLRAGQAEWARCRPVADRRAVPPRGAVVGLRTAEGGPVVRATVMEVLGMEQPRAGDNPDLMVWRVAVNESRKARRGDGPNGYLWELVEDPWPVLLLRVDPVGTKGARLFVESREERLSPFGGWLPADRITER